MNYDKPTKKELIEIIKRLKTQDSDRIQRLADYQETIKKWNADTNKVADRNAELTDRVETLERIIQEFRTQRRRTKKMIIAAFLGSDPEGFEMKPEINKPGVLKNTKSSLVKWENNEFVNGEWTLGKECKDCDLCLYLGYIGTPKLSFPKCGLCPLTKVYESCPHCHSAYQKTIKTGDASHIIAALKKAVALVESTPAAAFKDGTWEAM